MQRQDQGGGSASRTRAAGTVLLLAHLLTVGWLTLRPRTVPWISPPNLQPFATIRADLASGPQAALEGIGGGLLLLAPLGVLLPLVSGRLHRPLLSTAARTVLAGVFIALGLGLLRSGVPGQVVNVDVVMLNAAGVALAHLLLYPPLRARLRRGHRRGHARKHGRGHGRTTEGVRVESRQEGTQGPTPRPPRVGIAP